MANERSQEPQFKCDECGEVSFGGINSGQRRLCSPCWEDERPIVLTPAQQADLRERFEARKGQQ